VFITTLIIVQVHAVFAMPLPHYLKDFKTDLMIQEVWGRTHEMVYAESSQISRLDWTNHGLRLLRLSIETPLFEKIVLTAELAKKLQGHSGTMVDKDWLGLNDPVPTLFSKSAIKTQRFSEFDLRLSYPCPFHHDLQLQAGWFLRKTEWDAIGGAYLYDGILGAFDIDEVGLNYAQTVHFPYLGASASFEEPEKNYTLHARFYWGFPVDAHDVDYHYMRELRFDDYFKRGTAIGLETKISHDFSARLTGYLQYNYHLLNKIRGSTDMYDLSEGGMDFIGTFEDGAGIRQNYQIYSVGMQYLY
jgi:outer membrane protease